MNITSPPPCSPVFSGTINEAEARIERYLDKLQKTSETTCLADAREILLGLRQAFSPSGLRTSVQLEEDGRKKRSTADASNWNFKTGEIVLLFEPAEDESASTSSAGYTSATTQLLDSTLVAETEVQQLCEALDKSERDGRAFIALKQFRDLTLPAYPFAWASKAEERQRVLKAAVDAGSVIISKRPNPKLPSFPTSTISLNRQAAAKTVASRFNPIEVEGEPVSLTLLRDRG